MGVFETVVASAAVPIAGTLTPAAAVGGQTLTVRGPTDGGRVSLAGLWTQGASVNDVRVRSPRMHDPVNGIRLRTLAARVVDLMPGDMDTPLVEQDTLLIDIGNTGVAETDLAVLQVYYETLRGVDSNFATWDQVKPRVVHLTSNEIAIAAGAAAAWSAGTAWSTGSWSPEPNTEYAILGYECSVAEAVVAVQATGTSNLFYGGPGDTDMEYTRDYFKEQSRASGLPCIPIIASANQATILARTINAAGTAATVSFLLAQLS